MSDSIEAGAQSDGAVDIFNMSPREETGGAKESGLKGTHSVQRTESRVDSLISKVGPLHIGAVCALIAGGWIAWPYIFGGSTALPGSGPDVLTPSQAMVSASQVQQHYQAPKGPVRPASENSVAGSAPAAAAPPTVSSSSSGTAPVDAASLETSTSTSVATAAQEPMVPVAAAASSSGAAVASSASDTAAAAANGHADRAVDAKVAELEQRVAALSGRLAVIEGRDAQRAAFGAERQAAGGKSWHGHRSVPHGARHHTSEAHNKVESAAAAGPSNVPNFTLNTVYRDQAWIESGERTYVVQQGDAINGMRIVRIDPLKREVVTSQGVIR